MLTSVEKVSKLLDNSWTTSRFDHYSAFYLVVSTLDPQEGSFSAVKDAKVPWSDEETLHLLDIWGKDSVQRALKGCLKNRHIFTQIAQKMAERGYLRSVEQCQTRIKRLKKYFRQNHKWVSPRTHVSTLSQAQIF